MHPRKMFFNKSQKAVKEDKNGRVRIWAGEKSL